MKQVNAPLPIFRIQTGELKARLVGGTPQAWARIALMTEEGVTVGDCSFSAWSERSWDLLRELSQSIEKDYEKTLRSAEYSQWGEEAAEDKDDGINFDEAPWGMKS